MEIVIFVMGLILMIFGIIAISEREEKISVILFSVGLSLILWLGIVSIAYDSSYTKTNEYEFYTIDIDGIIVQNFSNGEEILTVPSKGKVYDPEIYHIEEYTIDRLWYGGIYYIYLKGEKDYRVVKK